MEILLHIEFICEFNFRRNKNDTHKLKKHETGKSVLEMKPRVLAWYDWKSSKIN